ncbi:MAG: type I-E CRISPR-associated endonuclease Cas1 [Phototrophicales bacterium]|nr:MAG: type I-E CRISPR-associated endonuclease Cas1 [Phototrophicales bacterium]RMG70784.1 MAG: type I-E CRISPR-associated endonuclease Cas1 [Chloroflexota bacterium]
MLDLHILPKLRDSLSYLYIEHAVIQRYRQAVEAVDANGKTAIPVASLSVLLLGPGTSITHDAIKLLARNGCSVLWVGEGATRFYAQGTGETRKASRLRQQAALVSDMDSRRQVAIRMYEFRFGEPLDPDLTLEQIRGHEGARVRNTYQFMSRRFGVKWRGRRYDRNEWDASDPLNRALSAANALLNGICHAAIVSGGYAPGLGFVHSGKQLSFVYDIADLYKTELTIPIAFEVVAMSTTDIEPRIRRLCRERFKEAKLLQRILPDIDNLLNIHEEPEPDYDEDGALPGPLIGEELW